MTKCEICGRVEARRDILGRWNGGCDRYRELTDPGFAYEIDETSCYKLGYERLEQRMEELERAARWVVKDVQEFWQPPDTAGRRYTEEAWKRNEALAALLRDKK